MMTEKYVLFTNIRCITLAGVRLHCRALVLSEDNLQGHTTYKVRGFNTEAAVEVFDSWIGSLDYDLENVTPETSMGAGPRYSSYKLTLNGMELDLWTEDTKQEIDVQTFEGNRVVRQVWEALASKVECYWQAPAIPMSVPVPPHNRRGMQKSLGLIRD